MIDSKQSLKWAWEGGGGGWGEGHGATQLPVNDSNALQPILETRLCSRNDRLKAEFRVGIGGGGWGGVRDTGLLNYRSMTNALQPLLETRLCSQTG